MSRIEKTTIVATALEPLWPDEHVGQVREHRDGEDQFEHVGDAHIRSNQATRANMSPIAPTIAAIMSRSITRSSVGALAKGSIRKRAADLWDS